MNTDYYRTMWQNAEEANADLLAKLQESRAGADKLDGEIAALKKQVKERGVAIAGLNELLDESRAYADRLAAGLPCLPKNVLAQREESNATGERTLPAGEKL